MVGRHWRLLSAALLASCGGNTSLPIDARCNPLGAGACLAPFPSSAFEIADPSTATGRRLAIPEGAIPRGITDVDVDPTRWNAMDGFSASAPIVIAFPGGVSPVGLPPADNMDVSLAPDSPTVILDMTTGVRVAHFAELDAAAESTPDTQALLLRPAARLIAGHRYAVAITTRVLAKDGSELSVSPGFAALRDGRRTDHHLLEAMRPRFEEVLLALEDADVLDGDLVVAWDFTVASDSHVRGDLTAARERAMVTLKTSPSLYTVTSDVRVDDNIRRKITGTLDAPLILSNGGEARVGTRVVRDDAGLPAIQGLYRIPFTAIVPACAYKRATPVPMIIYGHSAFGDSSEVGGEASRSLADELCMVVVGTDLRGMSRADLPALARVADDLSRTDEVFDVLLQGMIDHATLLVAMRTLFTDELFKDGSRHLVDPSQIFYVGAGPIAIAGASLVALEPSIQRGALFGAGGLVAALDRAQVAPRLANAYPDALSAVLAQELMQMRWDRIEAAGMHGGKPLLVQVSPDDPSRAAAYWLARSLDFAVVTPAPLTPWGFRTAAGPARSGLVINRRSVAQIREFFASGRVTADL